MECPDLWEIENSLFAQGCGCLCGVEEAGAGPLAGRVYAGAVILPRGWGHPYLNDSKQVTERRREILYDRICQEARIPAETATPSWHPYPPGARRSPHRHRRPGRPKS